MVGLGVEKVILPCSSHSLLEKIATKGTGAIADSASVPEYLEATNMTSAMPNSPWGKGDAKFNIMLQNTHPIPSNHSIHIILTSFGF